MSILEKIGVVVLTLLAPVAWGLTVEWVSHHFHTTLMRRRTPSAGVCACASPSAESYKDPQPSGVADDVA